MAEVFRIAFNEECYGWIWNDGTFEPETMPEMWRHDMLETGACS